jgi:hypothetical protein
MKISPQPFEHAQFLALCARHGVDPQSIPDAPSGNRAQRRYMGRIARRYYQRSPDREKSLLRRRRLAASGCLPPTMACHLTTGEQAVARIIADEISSKGTCELTLDEIAARAGVCGKTAQRTMRRLGAGKQGYEVIVGLNWITVEERPRKGRKHLPNVVKIISSEWIAWIERRSGKLGRIGGHLRPTTDTRVDDRGGDGREKEKSGLSEEAIEFAEELANIAGYRRDGVPDAWRQADPGRCAQAMLDAVSEIGMAIMDLRQLCVAVARAAPQRPYSPRYFLTSVKRSLANWSVPLVDSRDIASRVQAGPLP